MSHPSWRATGRASVAIVAITFASVAFSWLTTPDVRSLKRENPTATAFMALREREARAAGKPVTRDLHWVGYDHISGELKRAVLLSEDAAFWQHHGIDLEAIREAIHGSVERGEALRGASTITQQLAKNLYLSPSRDPFRKLQELFITRRLEAELSKRRILELYLNLIEWGDGIWGVGAASEAYFGIPASDLSTDQAALLAGAIINPRTYNPAHPNARLRQRQAIILRKMSGFSP